MKATITVGEWEKHTVVFEYNDIIGIGRVTVDGVVVHKKISLGLHKSIGIGEKEKHTVSVQYGLKQFLSGSPVVSIDGRPILPSKWEPLKDIKHSVSPSVKSWRWSFDAKDYTILGGGLLSTALIIVLANFFLRWDVAFISLMVWGILPAGAVGLGFLSAGGFFLTARFLHRKMSLMAAILMIVILVPAYFGHYYLVFKSLKAETEDGDLIPLSAAISFKDYYQWDLTNRSYKIGHGPTPDRPIGNWGYLFGLLELLGFIAGGIALMIRSSSIRYCDPCQKYFKSKEFARTTDALLAQQSKDLIDQRRELMFLDQIPDWRIGPGANLQTYSLSLDYCPECHGGSVITLKHYRAANDVKTICEMDLSREATLKLMSN